MRISPKNILYSILFLASIASAGVLVFSAVYTTDIFAVKAEAPRPAFVVVPAPAASSKEDLVTPVDHAPEPIPTPVSSATAEIKDTPPKAVAAAVSGPRLVIPAIGVNAPLESVGLDGVGNMATPYHLRNVGWYEYGTPIGDVGSAVIAGHVDNAFGAPAVFYHLKELKEGDAIYVAKANGEKIRFLVTDVASYSVETAPVEAIFNDKSGQRLIRLITCEKTGSLRYDDRIVVTAVLAA